MGRIREIITLGLSERKKAGIKVRQPIASLKIKNQKLKIKNNEGLLNLIKDELNVKEVIFDSKINGEVELDTKITPELRKEGMLREILHQIQAMRRDAKLKPKDKIKIIFDSSSEEIVNLVKENKEFIQKTTLAREISQIKKPPYLIEKEVEIDEKKLWLAFKR